MVYQIDKQLKELGDKLEEADKAPIDEALTAARAALESGELQALEEAKTGLESAAHKLAEKVYAAQGADAAPGAEGGEPEASDDDDDVIDAEFDAK